MKRQVKTNCQTIVLAAIATIVFMFAGNLTIAAQGKYKVDDRVECDNTESGKHFEKGTVIAFQADEGYNGYSQDSGYFTACE